MRLCCALIVLLLTGCQIEQLNSQDNTSSAVTAIDITSVLGTSPTNIFTDPSGNNQPEYSDVQLYWFKPLTRANGQLMPDKEIGGYEIRYSKHGESSYSSLILPPGKTQHTFLSFEEADSFDFSVAVFDVNGLYSEFIKALN